jgi:predicted DNA-binding transcriptional regulator AlpA
VIADFTKETAMSGNTQEALVSTRHIRERYDKTERTIHRWMKDDRLGFPQPIRINGRLYVKLGELEAWEAKQGNAR